MFIGGLDIGTSGCKVTVYDDKGRFIENHYQEYESIHSGKVHEIDANEILRAVGSVIEATESEIEALGVTSFGETFVMLDENDNVLLNSMLYTDSRGGAESELFDRESAEKITYYAPHGMYSIPKIMWIKNNRPEIYNSAKRILLMQDFICYMLTGNACIDYSLASRTMGFDIRNKKWSEEIFKKAGIDIDKMSKPAPSGTIVGVSNKFGLKNTKIIAACHDQVAAAIGAGALEQGTAVLGSGSVECLTPVFDKLPEDISVCNKGYAFVSFLENKYVCYAFSFTGGTALKWFRDNFASDESYKELDSKVSDKPSEILVLPHFAGAATPYMDADSAAVFSGMTLGTSKYDLYRAVMEGVAYEMKVNFENLSRYIKVPEMLYATGGGAKSAIWLQMKADILNVPITVIDAPEAGALGTIMLSAAAVGAVKDLHEAKDIFVKTGETYYPDSDRSAEYAPLYEKYKLIYNSAKKWRI